MSDQFYLDSATPEELRAIVAEQKRALEGRRASSDSPFEPPARTDYRDDREWRDSFQRRFNESTRGSRASSSPSDPQATWSVREGDKYVRELLGTRAAAHLARNSSVPAVRAALGKIRWEDV